jgi:ATP-dependent RNA helicase DbpA
MITNTGAEPESEALPVADPDGTAFESLKLAAPLLQAVQELGFTKLTPIQAQGIPKLLQGQDLVGQSRTGSGKTAAYALPLLNRLDLNQRQVSALVVCPTRELTDQVARELRKFGRHLPGLNVVVVVGGQPAREQTRALERGAHIVVGTPGRLNDLVTRGKLQLEHVTYVVLDEADRMLEMGFEADVTNILGRVPKERQTAFFSATFPVGIKALSAKYQRAPAFVDATHGDTAPSTTEELAVQLGASEKIAGLLWVLGRYTPTSALVFANQKQHVTEIEHALNQNGVSAASLHGDLEQFDRDLVMAKFRNGSTRVLVATDVAARGLDVDQLDLVVNLELPKQPEVYVHRVGRTGRAGNLGHAITLYCAAEQSQLDVITRFTGRPIQHLDYRAQADRGRTPATASREAPMETLRISGGRKDKLRPSDILGALTGEAGGLEGTQVGKIEIHDHFSYVAIAKDVSGKARQSLSTGKIKGKRFRVDVQ